MKGLQLSYGGMDDIAFTNDRVVSATVPAILLVHFLLGLRIGSPIGIKFPESNSLPQPYNIFYYIFILSYY